MAHHVFTRRVLYERVWAEPMSTVAQNLGVSDVGLAKACKAAGIPVPPRGWWAKRQHGKPLASQPVLTDRPDLPDRVTIRSPPPKPLLSAAAETAAATVLNGPEINVANDLRGAHPIVQGWVNHDQERRRNYRQNGWGTSGLEVLTTPLSRRRLRLTSAILKGLEAQGLTLGEDREWLKVGRGKDEVHFRLFGRSKIVQRPATADELRWHPDRPTVRATVPADDLILKVKDWLSIPTEYRELKVPLERQLTTIVANLAAGVTEQKELRQARELQHERWLAAEAVRKKQAAYDKAGQDLKERLIAQAARRSQADAIRAYVQAADASPAANGKDYAGWRAWAQLQASTLDPLMNGSAPFELLPPIEAWEWRGW